ncbi:MAG: nuclear transport factor 2 family protein [Acidobacteriota bacterium]
MTRETLESWLRAYGAAWEERNAQAAVDLFAEDAVYSVLPFTSPLRGRIELLKYWKHVTSSQQQIHFDFEILAAGPAEGVVHWWASFLRPSESKRLQLDGIFVVSLDSEGRCTRFQEWWHKRETLLSSGRNISARNL